MNRAATTAEILGQVRSPVLPTPYTHEQLLQQAQIRLADFEEMKAVLQEARRRNSMGQAFEYVAKEITSTIMRLEQLRGVELVLPCRDQYRS